MHKIIYIVVGIFVVMAICFGVGSCEEKGIRRVDKAEEGAAPDRDPLPSELAIETISEDSVRQSSRDDVKRRMTEIITAYRKKFTEDYFTGYFLTDIDHDGMPELWVKIGNVRDNAKLELYTAGRDGTLVKSVQRAEPGKYYRGDRHLIQVVTSGPGIIHVNKITINKGEMEVENIRDIDLYEDPGAQIPTFKEPLIHDASFRNLTPLNEAFAP